MFKIISLTAFIGAFLSSILINFASAQVLDITSTEAHKKMLQLVLGEDTFPNAKNAAESDKEIKRAQKLVKDILKNEKLRPFQNTKLNNGSEWYKYLSAEPGAGVDVQIDPDTGLGSVTVYDNGTLNGLPLSITLPVEPAGDFDDDDLFTPPPLQASELDKLPIPSYESDDLFNDLTRQPVPQPTQNTRKNIKDFQVDRDYTPIIMTQKEFDEFTGSIDGYWQVREEIWHIEVGEPEHGQVLRDKKDIETQLENVEDQLRRIQKTSKVFMWRNIENPDEVVKQKRFKGLDIEEWEWLGEKTDPDQIPVIEKLQRDVKTLNAMLSRTPGETSFDPAGFESMSAKGARSIKISSVEGDCTYTMTRAYFDGRTLGAETSLDKLCALNKALPEAIKQQLLAGGYPRNVISMLGVNNTPRTGELTMTGRLWSRQVHHDHAGTTINKVSGLLDLLPLSATHLTSQLPTQEEVCDSQYCAGRSCEYNAYVFQNLLDKEAIYNQYLQSLYAEEEAIGRLYEVQLANSKRSAARLEAARYATHILDFTSEMIGLQAEINGILTAAYKPGAGFQAKEFINTLQDPVKLFELIKDVESVYNRIQKARHGLDKNVESVRYFEEDKKAAKNNLEKLKSIRGVKELEDFLIDIYPPQLGAIASGALVFKDNESYLKGVAFIKRHLKLNTSNIVDAPALLEYTAAHKAFKQYQNNSTLAKAALDEAYRARNAGNAERATAAIKRYGKLQNAALEAQKVQRTKIGAASFALAQIALRSVKTYYLDDKLEEFRERIKTFRKNIMPVAQNAIDHGEKLSEVRERILEFRQLLKNTKRAIASLTPCIAENCDIDFTSFAAQSLPDMEARADGSIAYGLVQNRLDAVLKDMELQDVKALAAENVREKTCPLDKDFVAQVLDETSECEQCEEYVEDEKRLEKQIAFLNEQIGTKIPTLHGLNDLKIERRNILDEMARLQKDFLAVTQGSEDSGYSIIFTGNWFDDEEQTKQADLHNQIMGNRVKLRSLKRQIEHIQQQADQVSELEDKMDAAQKALKSVQINARNCREEYCSQ